MPSSTVPGLPSVVTPLDGSEFYYCVQGGNDRKATGDQLVRRLTANTTYYVSLTGSDSNDGLTAGTPWRTLSYAATQLNYVVGNNHTVTIQLADGDYSGDGFLNWGPSPATSGLVGLTIQGNTLNRAAVTIASQQISYPINIPLVFQYLKVKGFITVEGGNCILNYIDFTPNASSVSGIACDSTVAYVVVQGDMTLNGGGWSASAVGGTIQWNVANLTAAVAVTPVTSCFKASARGYLFVATATNFSGTFNGTKFDSLTDATINVAQIGPSAGIDFFPGAGGPGTTDAGGHYIYVDTNDSDLEHMGEWPVADPIVSYPRPVTGDTIALTDAPHVVIDSTSALATLTLKTVPFPQVGQVVEIRTHFAITTLTLTSTAGHTLVNAPTTLPVNTRINGIFRSSDTTWFF